MEMVVSEPSPKFGSSTTPHSPSSPLASPPPPNGSDADSTLHPFAAHVVRPLTVEAFGQGASSNFPSPSSTFLPPPVVGQEEFAIKRAPKGRRSRQTSMVGGDRRGSEVNGALAANGKSPLPSPVTPTAPTASTTSPSILTTTSIVSPPPPLGNSPVSTDSQPNSAISSNATPTAAFPQLPTPVNKTGSGFGTASMPVSPATSMALKRLSAQVPSTMTPINEKRLSAPNPPSSPPSAFSPSTGFTGPASPSSPQNWPSSKRLSQVSNASSSSSKLPTTPTRMGTHFRSDSTSSLHSNRPAPASPALSRRQSGTTPSTPGDRVTSSPVSGPGSYFVFGGGGEGVKRSASNSSRLSKKRSMTRPERRTSRLGEQVDPNDANERTEGNSGTIRVKSRPSDITTSLPTPFSPSLTTGKGKIKWNPIIVHDFAYSGDDDRSKGLGLDCPKPNRLRTLNKPLYTNHRASVMSAITTASSTTSSRFKFETEEDGGPPHHLRTGEDTAGSKLGVEGFDIPGFKWGSWSWALKRDVDERATDQHFPESDSDDVQGDEDDDDEGGLLAEEEPLYPGLYRSLYSFDPEPGSSEMALAEGQIIRVVGRGGGPGWVVCVVEESENEGDLEEGEEEGEKHALVPESYLELVEVDEGWEEWEDEDESDEAAGHALEQTA